MIMTKSAFFNIICKNCGAELGPICIMSTIMYSGNVKIKNKYFEKVPDLAPCDCTKCGTKNTKVLVINNSFISYILSKLFSLRLISDAHIAYKTSIFNDRAIEYQTIRIDTKKPLEFYNVIKDFDPIICVYDSEKAISKLLKDNGKKYTILIGIGIETLPFIEKEELNIYKSSFEKVTTWFGKNL